MGRHEEVLEAATRRFGPLRVVADCSWSLGLAVVLEVAADDGSTLFVKGHKEQRRFNLEVEAYRDVIPSISDRAPALVWADAHARAIATTKLDGLPLDEIDLEPASERAIYRDAGRVLRRLHDAKPSVKLPDWAERKIDGFERWVARAPEGLLDPNDVDFARSALRELPSLPAPRGVPCHGDWQPRNWLINDGEVNTFDFERTATNWWCHDLHRMWWREWTNRSDLTEAHLDGYGRTPSDDELAMINAVSAAEHVTQIVWATEHQEWDFASAGRENLAAMRAAG